MSLQKIQEKLNSPKGQYNDFGKYKYRSCEDILSALKPLLVEYKATIILNDELVLIGDRYYIKSTAHIAGDGIDGLAIGYAREPESKKGMDASQITGAASSYARKYALNGLLAIDDTKDVDTMDNDIEYISDEQVANIVALCEEVGKTVKEFCIYFKIEKIEDLITNKYKTAVNLLEAKRNDS